MDRYCMQQHLQIRLDSGVGSRVYSRKLDLKIYIHLSDYCSIYQAVQKFLINCFHITRIWIFSDHQISVERCGMIDPSPGTAKFRGST